MMNGDLLAVETLLTHVYGENFVARELNLLEQRLLLAEMAAVVFQSWCSVQSTSSVSIEFEQDMHRIISAVDSPLGSYKRIRSWSHHLCTEMQQRQSDRQSKILSAIVAYIEDQYKNSELSLITVADHFGMTPQYMSTFFKKTSGMNLSDFITTLRVNKAKQLLSEYHLNISAISNRVGYTNPISFGRVFKKVAGVTPTQYRLSI